MIVGQLLEAADAVPPVSWVDVATLIVASAGGVVGVLAWATTSRNESLTRRQSHDTRAIDQGFARFNTALGYLYGGDPNLALEGVGILRDLRTAAWLDDAMKRRSAEALRNYTRTRSSTGTGSA